MARATPRRSSLIVDVALLNYRIYRRPEVILGMFKQRLKTLMLLNLEIALVISYGCLGTLYVLSPNQTLLTYCLVGLLPIGLAVFFSMHDLVLYYLLQPYNAKTEVKSGLYSLLRQLTYLLCLFLMNLDVPSTSMAVPCLDSALYMPSSV